MPPSDDVAPPQQPTSVTTNPTTGIVAGTPASNASSTIRVPSGYLQRILYAFPAFVALAGLSALALTIDSSPMHVERPAESTVSTPAESLPRGDDGKTFPDFNSKSSAPFTSPEKLLGLAPASRGSTRPQTVKPVMPDGSAPRDDPAAAAFARGVEAQKAGKNKEAGAAYRETLRLNPKAVPAHMNLALLALQMRRPNEALSHLKLAARLDPKNPAVPYQIAQTLLALQRPREALAPLQASLHLAPQNLSARALRAQLLYSLGQPQQAYNEWVQISKMAPKDAGAPFAAGVIAFENLKRPADAERWLSRAVRLEPRDPRGPLLLSRVLLVRDQHVRAESILAAAAERFPQFIEIHSLLSELRLARGDLKGAVKILRDITARVPASLGKGVPLGRLRLSLGRTLALSGQQRAAVAELRQSADLLPHAFEPRSLLAEVLLDMGDHAGAVAQWRRALHMDPKLPRERLMLARTLADLGQIDGALENYTIYLKARPGDVRALAAQAVLLERRGRLATAITVWQRIGGFMPENSLPALQAARLLRRSGRNAAALERYRYVLQISANEPNALKGAAELEEKAGQSVRALGHLRALIRTQPENAAAYDSLLRVAAQKHQLPAAVNFLKQQLAKNPNRRAVYDAILTAHDRVGETETGRAIVSDLAQHYPKASAPRLSLAAFDKSRTKVATPAKQPTTAPTATPIAVATAAPTAPPVVTVPDAAQPQP
jgi:tetratricopeptide (TPR) repeat protein